MSLLDGALWCHSEKLERVTKITGSFLVVYRKSDSEWELLKDRSQMAFSSLITAFGMLLGYSTKQRGPTVTSCLGFLTFPPSTGSAHAFWTTTSWTFQARSVHWHPHPLPGALCTPPFSRGMCSTSELCSFGGGYGLAWGRIMVERQCLQTLLCAWHLWDHVPSLASTAAAFERQVSSKQLARAHSFCLLEERHCTLFEESSSKGLRVMESCCYHTWGWMWTSSMTDCDAENSSWAQCSLKCKVFASGPVCHVRGILAV